MKNKDPKDFCDEITNYCRHQICYKICSNTKLNCKKYVPVFYSNLFHYFTSEGSTILLNVHMLILTSYLLKPSGS